MLGTVAENRPQAEVVAGPKRIAVARRFMALIVRRDRHLAVLQRRIRRW